MRPSSDIENFTAGLTYEEFSTDKKTFNAVIRSLTIIGEAANRLSDETTTRHSETEWHKVVAFRNRLVHEYFGIDYEMVWEVIKNYLSILKKNVQKILNEL
jgi:uncharacterized protein with HEPN domain